MSTKPYKIETPREALEFIAAHDSFLISSHVNPDGDGLGAVMGIKWALLKLGKQAEIVIDSDPPEMFSFFENYGWIKSPAQWPQGAPKATAVITADAPNLERLGAVGGLIADGAAILAIDHHISSETFGTVNFIDERAAASSEMVVALVKSLGLSPDKACAEYLYSGILIDTGRFRFSNTSPAVLNTAAELVAAGVKPDKVSERIFYHNTLETTRALGRMINTIALHAGGRIATAYFDLPFIQSDEWKSVDTEGFVNHALAIRGVEVAVLFKETKAGVTRASLRAKNDYDVNRVAGVFGGGGHAKASGCTINQPLEDAIKTLVAEIGKGL